jgi:hypothetical protein
MSARSFSLGIFPESESLVALTMIMNLIVVSPSRCVLGPGAWAAAVPVTPPCRSVHRGIDSPAISFGVFPVERWSGRIMIAESILRKMLPDACSFA